MLPTLTMAPRNTFWNARVPRCSQNTRNPLSPALGGPLSRDYLDPQALSSSITRYRGRNSQCSWRSKKLVYASKKKQKTLCDFHSTIQRNRRVLWVKDIYLLGTVQNSLQVSLLWFSKNKSGTQPLKNLKSPITIHNPPVLSWTQWLFEMFEKTRTVDNSSVILILSKFPGPVVLWFFLSQYVGGTMVISKIKEPQNTRVGHRHHRRIVKSRAKLGAAAEELQKEEEVMAMAMAHCNLFCFLGARLTRGRALNA